VKVLGVRPKGRLAHEPALAVAQRGEGEADMGIGDVAVITAGPWTDDGVTTLVGARQMLQQPDGG